MKHTLISLAVLMSTLPALAFAVTNVFDFELLIISLLGKLGYLFWILAIVAFFYGLVKFIANADDAAEREKGKNMMLWGMISLVVLVSMWAIVRFILVDTLLINAAPLQYKDKSGTVVP